MFLLTPTQIKALFQALEKYPETNTVVIYDVPNSSGIGPDTIAEFQDKGNIFKQIAPTVLGTEDITDVGLW